MDHVLITLTPRKVLDSLTMEIAYVKRDPRALISRLLEDGEVTEEEVQVFAAQLCARIKSFASHSSSSHNVYQVARLFFTSFEVQLLNE